MNSSPRTTSAMRRALGAIGVAVVSGATLVALSAPALADPPPPPAPGCSAGDFEQLQSQVAAATAAYMFSHPDVNAFFSTLKGQPKDQVRSQAKTYLAANPQTKAEMAAIRQPLTDMKARCA